MTEELLKKILDIQNHLYGAYKNEVISNYDWLNNISKEFSEFFDSLKHLLTSNTIKIPANKTLITKFFHLIINQIVICIKFLEKTVKQENDMKNGSCLITSRQYFFDRIFWCIARGRSLLLSINDDVLSQSFQEKENFFSSLDKSLEMLEDFTNIHEENTNEAVTRAELMMSSKKIREQVDVTLSSNFVEVVLESDKNPIECLSRNILSTALKFVEEFSLQQAGRGKSLQQKIIISELDTELCSLESFVSDALLRLIFKVFNDLRNLRNINEDVENFQILMERIIHIGSFAVYFSFDQWEDNSIVKSCLTSIESLYPYLIRSLTEENDDPSLEIFQHHFEEECEKFQHVVHKLIDSKSLCKSLVEQIEKCCNDSKKGFQKNDFKNLIDYAKILLTHLEINKEVLKLSSDLSFPYNDLKLIFNECCAILTFDEDSKEFNKKILKRFNILKNTINKLLTEMDSKSNLEVEPPKSKEKFNTKDRKVSIRHSLRMNVLKKNFKLANEEILTDETSLEVTKILSKLTTLSMTLGRKIN